MALNIKDRATEDAVRALAKATGLSITDAVREAAEEKLMRTSSAKDRVFRELMAIGDRLSKYEVVDNRSIDDMLYDENGLPK